MHWLPRVTILLLWPLLTHTTFAQPERTVVLATTTHRLTGTLTLPPGQGQHPGIVIILGSGSQNRDGETEGVRPFKQLATQLARKGFVVLRYDNHSTGSSGGKPINQSTTSELATDARAAVHFLARQPSVDANRIGLIGHSEGATIATIAATQETNLAFLLLINGTCLPGREDILVNTKQRLQRAGLSGDAIISYLKNLTVFLSDPVSTPSASRRRAVRQLIIAEISQLPPDQRTRITEKDINSSVSHQLADASSRWQRQYLVLNPALYYPKVRCPVSLFFSQSEVEGILASKLQNFEAILRKGKQPYSIQVVREADHNLLQPDSGSKLTQSTRSVSIGFINQVVGQAETLVAKRQTTTHDRP